MATIKQNVATIKAAIDTMKAKLNLPASATLAEVTEKAGSTKPKLQEKTLSPSDNINVVTQPDAGYDGLSKVTVNKITSAMIDDLKPEIIKRGVKVLDMTGTYGETSQVKVVYPTTGQQVVRPDEGIKFLESVTVQGVDRSIDPDIQASNIKKGIQILGVEGTYEGDFRLQNKTASLSTSDPITYTADDGYNALESVTVPKVTSAIDGNIKPDNIKKGVSILNVMGTYEILPAQTEKYVSPASYEKLVYPDSGYSSMNRVRVGGVNSSIDSNIQPNNIRKGVSILGVLGTAEATIPQAIIVNPSLQEQTITPTEGYNCISRVKVNPVTSDIDEYIIPTNIKNGINILGVTGTYDGENILLQQKTITPTDNVMTITADADYEALSVVTINPPEIEDIEIEPSLNEIVVNKKKDKFINSVTVKAVSSDVDKNIQPENIKKNMSILGVVGNYEGEDPEEPFITHVSSGGNSSSYWSDSHDSNVSNSHAMPGIVKNVLRIPGTLAVSNTNLQSAFEGMTSLTEAPSIDFTGVTTAYRMFLNCSSLSSENFPKYNSGSCTDWYYAFCKCSNLTRVPEHDYSGAKSVGKMFCDAGIVEIPSNLMEMFPKVTDMSAMFYGCPVSGELRLTLGSEYHRDNNIQLSAGDFAPSGKYNVVNLKIASNVKFSGKSVNSSASSSFPGLPNGKVETVVEYVDGGYISTLYYYVPLHTSDSVCRINSERNHDFNLEGCTSVYYFFGSNNSSAYYEDIYLNAPDTTEFTGAFYQLYNFLGDIYLHVGPNCTTMSSAFVGCKNLKRILPYTEGKPVIDGSKMSNISNAFKNASSLIEFEGITDLGKAYTYKSANYSYYKLDLSAATNLSVESLRSIILRLYDLNISYKVAEGGTLYRQQLILGATNLAKLTEDEIAIATNKGWNVS